MLFEVDNFFNRALFYPEGSEDINTLNSKLSEYPGQGHSVLSVRSGKLITELAAKAAMLTFFKNRGLEVNNKAA